MELKVIKPFSWAHQHVRIEHFEKDQVIETKDKELIRVSLEEKWTAKKRGSESNTQANAQTSAPENKALPGADENKEPAADGNTDTSPDGAGAAD